MLALLSKAVGLCSLNIFEIFVAAGRNGLDVAVAH
jgi:hypothetical protein